MTARGYASATDVQTYLGVTLTTAQAAAVTGLLEAVEQAVDAEAGRAWKTGAVASEWVYPISPVIYLAQAPITTSAVTVTGRTALDTGGTLLTEGTDWEIQDRTRGRLYVGAWAGYDRLAVSYTPDQAVPEPVRWATAMSLAHFLSPHLNGLTSEVESYSVFGQVSARLRAEGLPPDARLLLRPYRPGLVVA
jgi:hypothetical protein